MKVGINHIETSQYGMPALHMEAFRKSAEQVGGAIGVRPVSKFAHTYIKQAHPTKPFNVKTKSANSGPIAGLIAFDATYGRLPVLSEKEKEFPAAEQDKIFKNKLKIHKEKYKKEIMAAAKKDQFKNTPQELKPINLVITTQRLQELTKLDATMQVEELKDSKYKLKLIWGEKNNLKEAYCKEEANQSLSVFDKNDKPIKILGRTLPDLSEKGITADYDLLVYCHPYATVQTGGLDKSPFRTSGINTAVADKNASAVIKDEKAAVLENRPPLESATGGNWSKRVEELVKSINETIAELDSSRRGSVLDTVHHNSEFTNPFADDLRNNLPCLFALPKVMDLSEMLIATGQDPTHSELESARLASVVLIETPAELTALRNTLRDNGYFWPSHARYAEVLPPLRPETMEMINADKAKVAAERATDGTSSKRNSTALIFQSINANPAVLLNEAKQAQAPVKVNKITVETPNFDALKRVVIDKQPAPDTSIKLR
jgi:hypothetical protein